MANTFAVTIAEAWDVGCQAVSHKLLVMADAQELLARHMCYWTGTAWHKQGSSGRCKQHVTCAAHLPSCPTHCSTSLHVQHLVPEEHQQETLSLSQTVITYTAATVDTGCSPAAVPMLTKSRWSASFLK